jgi:hypothetical protein
MMSRSIPKREPTGTTVTRRALRLGVLASLFALIGRATARAADALTIGPDGTIDVGKRINFGKRVGELLTLYASGYAIGIQNWTSYARSDKNFAWYKGGTHSDGELQPGEGGTKMMSLTNGTLTVSDQFVGKGAVPPGAILMWSGAPTKLSPGWALCDGQNGTPDLRGRFIVGYNPNHPDYKTVKNTGGEDKHTLTIAEMPVHDHGSAGQHAHSFTISSHGWAFAIAQSGDTRAQPISKAQTDQAGAHVHQQAGGGQAAENRPAYYVLAFIMYAGK